MDKQNSKAKLTFVMLIKCMAAGIVALMILSVFCYFFSYSGTRVKNKSGATDFKWASNEFKSNAFEGYSWFHMDKHGFNNIDDSSKNPDILLMGSSHMEAANVKQSDSVASRLSQKLSLDVYNIAMSAHTIYNCVNNMDAAVNQYKPSDYVILETMTTQLSVGQMQSVIDGKFVKYDSADSGMFYYLQKYCPALKNIYKQISVWSSGSSRSAVGADADTSKADKNYEDTLHKFLSKAKNAAAKSGAKLVIFYHPEIKIDKNANAYTVVENKEKFELFEKTCEELSIIYVDMTDTFLDMYKQQHILPYGFSNTAVSAAHLNKHGHEAITQQIIKSISEDK